MNTITKNKIFIGLAIGLLMVAVIIGVITNLPSETFETVQILCVNPQCNNVFTLSTKECSEMAQKLGALSGPPSFKCPKCNQSSARVAMGCRQCNHVFVADYNSQPYDKCPKCGHSNSEKAAR